MSDQPIENAPPNLEQADIDSIMEAAHAESAPAEVTEGTEPAQPSDLEVLQKELQQERTRANGILNELRDERSTNRNLQGRFDQLADSWNQWQAQAQQPPPPEDPLEKIEWQNAQQNQATQQQVAQVQQQIAQYTQGQQEQARVQGVIQATEQAGAQFAAENPDYPQAVEHLKNQLRGYAKNMYGIEGPQAEALLAQEIFRFSEASLRAGQNPAAAAYAVAQQTGWQRQAQQQDTSQEDRYEQFFGPREELPVAPSSQGQAPAKAPVSLSERGGRADRKFDLATLADEDPEKFQEIAQNPNKWKAFMKELGHPGA